MLNEILRIADFIITNILHIWPYIIITIPLSVFLRLSGKFKSIEQILGQNQIISVFIATLIGAISPFCSCGVIPVIASLLLAGIPLAPVMAFWLASPSMDPEMFFLSASILGWKLALWRLLATFFMSLSGGFITLFLQKKGWLKGEFLRKSGAEDTVSISHLLKEKLSKLRSILEERAWYVPLEIIQDKGSTLCCQRITLPDSVVCECNNKETVVKTVKEETCRSIKEEKALRRRIVDEGLSTSLLVAKFMIAAFFLEALIEFYVPQEIIISYLGKENSFAILLSAIAGVPIYTSNITALPLIGALIKGGMSQAAALAFLISGPTTTIPAMAAVWKLASKQVFFLYVGYTLLSAVLMGYLFSLL